ALDLANNYAPPYGSAEETLGRVMASPPRPFRDEIFIATKAGYDMWPGPYGNWGSRKYLTASLDQSLRRMGLEYVDLFYSHRYDPETPIEETLHALVDAVRRGKALYAGISRWPLEPTRKALAYLRERDVPCLAFQERINIFDRAPVDSGVERLMEEENVGMTIFSSLAQGLLTNRYLDGIPADSRAARGSHLTASQITPAKLAQIRALNEVATERGETLARMATAWVLARPAVASVIAGCSSTAQLDDTLSALASAPFTTAQLERIEEIVRMENLELRI
ncbi:MAG: aldo/keto reductase, partial [Duncaniella sp.]|nr:aldo/keto reductase [Duncaniella sp.]